MMKVTEEHLVGVKQPKSVGNLRASRLGLVNLSKLYIYLIYIYTYIYKVI